MHDLLSQFLKSIMESVITDWMSSKTKREKRFLNKKETLAIIKKYKFSANLICSTFCLLLLLLIVAAIFQSNGHAMTALFLGSLYCLVLIGGAALCIHSLCRIRKDWNEHDFYLAAAVCGNMSPRRLEQLKFLLLILACSGLAYSTFRFLTSLF